MNAARILAFFLRELERLGQKGVPGKIAIASPSLVIGWGVRGAGRRHPLPGKVVVD